MDKDIKRVEYDTYWKMYERQLIVENTPKNSIKNRRSTIQNLFKYLCKFNNKPAFTDIKRVNLENFLMECENKLKPNTLNRYFSFLKDFFVFYKNRGINTNINFDDWKYKVNEDNDMVFLTDEQILYAK